MNLEEIVELFDRGLRQKCDALMKENAELRIQAILDMRLMAGHLCWMAQTVHQGAHEGGEWQDCRRGVCASMEQMLATVGLDKHLKPVDRRP